jgi:hypothetical protein
MLVVCTKATKRPQNIPLELADFSGTGWMTSQCSTTLQPSTRRMSTTAMPVHCNEVAVGDDAFDRVTDLWVLREERLQEPDRRVAPGLRQRVMLNVALIHPGFERYPHFLVDVKRGHESSDDLFGLQTARCGVRGSPGERHHGSEQCNREAHSSLLFELNVRR